MLFGCAKWWTDTRQAGVDMCGKRYKYMACVRWQRNGTYGQSERERERLAVVLDAMLHLELLELSFTASEVCLCSQTCGHVVQHCGGPESRCQLAFG